MGRNTHGYVTEVHTLQIPAITAIQKAYVQKVIDTVNDLDNVPYEISNESFGTAAWQYDVINFIKAYEAGKPKQHPVGMTAAADWDSTVLFNSPADWISPGSGAWEDPTRPYASNPAAADGKKIIVLDTDHIRVNLFTDAGFARVWVWKSLTQGLHQVMIKGSWMGRTQFQVFEAAMRDASGYANRMNLVAIRPQNCRASNGYCLANPGSEYLRVFRDSGANRRWLCWITLRFRMGSILKLFCCIASPW